MLSDFKNCNRQCMMYLTGRLPDPKPPDKEKHKLLTIVKTLKDQKQKNKQRRNDLATCQDLIKIED